MTQPAERSQDRLYQDLARSLLSQAYLGGLQFPAACWKSLALAGFLSVRGYPPSANWRRPIMSAARLCVKR